MKNLLPILVAVIFVGCSAGKSTLKVISVREITRIEKTLSADNMQGRAPFTTGIEKAENFISTEMRNTGLREWNSNKDFLQYFTMKKLLSSNAQASIDGKTIDPSNIICLSTNTDFSLTNNDGYKVEYVTGTNFRQGVRKLLNQDSNMLVIIDTSLAKNFKGLKRMQTAMFSKNTNKVFILSDNKNISQFSIKIHEELKDQQLANVVGYLPGKTKPQEYVIFSGHYDHLGIGKPDEKGDSIYNGANDDASGVTSLLMLARYFKKMNSNQRSLLFVAFTAEESGGFGSTYFSQNIPADSIAAMFNIEMVGTDSRWGSNSAYITGYEKTDFGKILEKNLSVSSFKVYPDPYPEQQLFYRSDNATLARLGVPAHTISTSKMDKEPHYHKASDEIQTLNMKNMTQVIRGIATGASSIVNGTDTPKRIIKE